MTIPHRCCFPLVWVGVAVRAITVVSPAAGGVKFEGLVLANSSETADSCIPVLFARVWAKVSIEVGSSLVGLEFRVDKAGSCLEVTRLFSRLFSLNAI